MITASNGPAATKSQVTNGVHAITADTKPPLGKLEGLGPHELLEASLASCLAITLRMVAMERGIAVGRFDPRQFLRDELRRIIPAHLDEIAAAAAGAVALLAALEKIAPHGGRLYPRPVVEPVRHRIDQLPWRPHLRQRLRTACGSTS